MKCRASTDAPPGVYEFEFVDATNMRSIQDPHMHAGKLKIIDPQHMQADERLCGGKTGRRAHVQPGAAIAGPRFQGLASNPHRPSLGHVPMEARLVSYLGGALVVTHYMLAAYPRASWNLMVEKDCTLSTIPTYAVCRLARCNLPRVDPTSCSAHHLAPQRRCGFRLSRFVYRSIYEKRDGPRCTAPDGRLCEGGTAIM